MSSETPLSEKKIMEILERCNRSSKAPWVSYIEGRDHFSGSDFIMTGEESGMIELSGATTADQDFIAQARQDIPLLINEIIRLNRNSK